MIIAEEVVVFRYAEKIHGQMPETKELSPPPY
jgi:hypothetical protein